MSNETPKKDQQDQKDQLPDNELEGVSGGFNPQPDPPGRAAVIAPIVLPPSKLIIGG